MPFLLLRSAMLGVTPSRLDLLGQRFRTTPHCDLLDQLTFCGLTRRFPLDFYCRAFGITSPKEGMSGADVGRLHAEGKYREIAAYNARDLLATAELYRRWLLFLSGERARGEMRTSFTGFDSNQHTRAAH